MLRDNDLLYLAGHRPSECADTADVAAMAHQSEEIIELMIRVDEAASRRDLDRSAIRTREEAAHPSVDSEAT